MMRDDTDRIGEILEHLRKLSEAVQTLIRLQLGEGGSKEKSQENSKVISPIVPEDVEVIGKDLSISPLHCEVMWEIKTSLTSLRVGEGTSFVTESRGLVEASKILVGQRIALVHGVGEFSFWEYVEVLEVLKKEGGDAKRIDSVSPVFAQLGPEKWVLPVGPVEDRCLPPEKVGDADPDEFDEVLRQVESAGFKIKAVSNFVLDGSSTREYVIEGLPK